MEGGNLTDLASELPDVVMSCRANSTTKQYGGAFISWCTWADKYGKSNLPADPYHISLYFIHISHTAITQAPISKACSAIAWAHKLSGFSDPCSSPLVTQAVEGLKWKLATPVSKKDPISAEILVKMYDYHCADLSVKNLYCDNVSTCLCRFSSF